MIAIIDYEAGNLASVKRAVSFIGYDCVVTNDIDVISHADRIIFPGVGAAGTAMNSLKRMGLDKVIVEFFNSGRPVLGICLGTQIIMGFSHENNTHCLKIIDGTVKAFAPDLRISDDICIKIPHMGWNRVVLSGKHPVFEDIQEKDEFYFVHGFYPVPDDLNHVLGVTDYGIDFASVIAYKNLIATQFHLEKSGRPGLGILKNFCRWNPC